MKKLDKAKKAIEGEFLTNYPTFHLMADGGCLCNKCIDKEQKLVLEATASPGTNSQWQYADTDVNYEQTDLYCDHCEKRIASAYCEDELSEEDQKNCVW